LRRLVSFLDHRWKWLPKIRKNRTEVMTTNVGVGNLQVGAMIPKSWKGKDETLIAAGSNRDI
jgi:hypothetical protein